jgi:uncharacterized membrane protein YdjX (TVP38/TMEM64 family)
MTADKQTKSIPWVKIIVFVVLAVGIGVGWWFLRDVLTLDGLAEREKQLKDYQSQNPVLVYGIAFLVYAAVTGFSLPGAAVMTVVYGWYFGLRRGVILVSFASTTGAVIAFLLSRYLFRDFVSNRFGKRQESFNNALEKEGPFFLFTLRAIPLVPYFVINAVMGVTPIKLITYWWVSQLGMLPGTIVYVYAGSTFPSLQKMADEGIWSAFTYAQTIQIVIAFVVIGVFPFLVRGVVKLLKKSGLGS